MPSLHKVISETLGSIYGGSVADNDDAASKVLRHVFANGYDLTRHEVRNPNWATPLDACIHCKQKPCACAVAHIAY